MNNYLCKQSEVSKRRLMSPFFLRRVRASGGKVSRRPASNGNFHQQELYALFNALVTLLAVIIRIPVFANGQHLESRCFSVEYSLKQCIRCNM